MSEIPVLSEFPTVKILGIDPGGTFGIVEVIAPEVGTGEIPLDTRTELFWEEASDHESPNFPNENGNFAYRLDAILRHRGTDVIVCEDAIPRTGGYRTRQIPRSALVKLSKQVGVVLALAIIHGTKLVMHHPGRRNTITKEEMKRYGISVKGRHARDALRHALCYVRTGK